MKRLVTTYIVAILLVTLGFFGLGSVARAQELRDPMQPPAYALLKFKQAKWKKSPVVAKTKVVEEKVKPLQLTSILISKDRKIAIIDDQMLVVGDRIRGAKLVKLTRDTARLVRKGKVINLKLNNDLAAVRKKAAESDL